MTKEVSLPKFPISQSDAARELQVSAMTVSVLIRANEIPTMPSPQNWRAKMLDSDGYRQLSVLTAKLKIVEAIESRQVASLNQG